MKTFEQWLSDKNENGLRTSLGLYPSLYGSSQYPPLYFSPISAVATLAFAKLHGGDHPDLLSKDVKKDWERSKDKKYAYTKKKKKKDKKED